MQSRLSSFIESLLNVVVGYLVALCTQLVVFPIFNITVTFGEQVSIGVIFTCVSLVRMYFFRRVFNRKSNIEGEIRHAK